MKRHVSLYGLAFLIFILSACVPAGQKSTKTDPKLAGKYIGQGQQLEKKGELPEALEQYKLALTVDPKNKIAGEGKSRLSQKLKVMAEQRYRLGMKYHRKGKYGLARKEFLTTLKFDPDHPGASKMLVSRQPEKAPKYTFHIVQPGESLSYIAKKYYGDYKKYDVIARFNRLDDATKVKPGQRLMIPEIEGVILPSVKPRSDGDNASFVLHTIKPGESISKLARIYYGDYKLFHAIAQYNGMDDATRVSVGQEIRIPKLAGVRFTPPAAVPVDDSQTDQPEQAPAQTAEQAPEEDSAKQEEPLFVEDSTNGGTNTEEQILAYREAGIELYNYRKYEDAIFELNKAIEANPDDTQTRTYLSKAYFEAGKQHFQQKDFDAAREAFESARQYNPECTECNAYIERSKLGPLLENREKGIASFNKNDYLAAIFQFQEFLQVRPDDEEARIFLSKSYYQQALIDYEKGDFLTAKKGFDSSLEYDGNCGKCSEYIGKSMRSYKESHYNKGIIYFNKEQLPEAIAEWEMVHEIDPGYKDVDHNLKKARALLEKLEKIKKSHQ